MTEYGYRYVMRKELYDIPDALAWQERAARRRLVEMVKDDSWMRLLPRYDQPMKWEWGDPDEFEERGGMIPCPWDYADHVWMRWTLETRDD